MCQASLDYVTYFLLSRNDRGRNIHNLISASLLSFIVPRGDNIDGKYLEWESKAGHAFCNGGFNYSSGDLVVPRNGFYRVFLQIAYESKASLTCERRTLINTVFVFRDAYRVDRPLLSSVDTVDCGTEPWIKSLYTSGMFYLEVNCRLRVTSSFRDLIVKEEHQVFFGAELLPQ